MHHQHSSLLQQFESPSSLPAHSLSSCHGATNFPTTPTYVNAPATFQHPFSSPPDYPPPPSSLSQTPSLISTTLRRLTISLFPQQNSPSLSLSLYNNTSPSIVNAAAHRTYICSPPTTRWSQVPNSTGVSLAGPHIPHLHRLLPPLEDPDNINFAPSDLTTPSPLQRRY